MDRLSSVSAQLPLRADQIQVFSLPSARFARWHTLCSNKETMKLYRFLLFGFSLGFVLALPTRAWAQTGFSVTIDERTGFGIEREKDRPTSQRPNWISRKDCNDGDENRFQSQTEAELEKNTWIRLYPVVTYPSSGSYTIEVWVSQSADCSDLNIINGNANSCSLVFATRADDRPDIYLNPRDIVEANSSLRAENWPGTDPTAGKETTCEKQVEKNLTYFVLVRDTDEIKASAKIAIGGVDTLAPEPPNSIDVAAGDEHIFFDWKIDSSNEAEDTYGFAFFCVPQGSASEDGATGIGGAGGGGGNDDCSQGILREGEIPSEEALSYICGSEKGRTSRKGQADDLENYTLYAVAIAATDTVRNKGKLSEVSCATPKEVTTFFESYKEAGGKGGGGFCALSRRSNGAHLAILLAGGLGLLLRRRRSVHK